MHSTRFVRLRRALALGALFVALGVPASAQNGNSDGKVDEVVKRALRDGRADVPLIVRYRTVNGHDRGRQKLSRLGALKRELRDRRMLGTRVNRATLHELLDDADVERVSYDAPVHAMQVLPDFSSAGTPVDASGARAARERYGFSGAGVTVAIIDSGLQPNADVPATRIKAFVDFVNGHSFAYDDYGHGTHVAGIIAGSGARSYGKYAGVAPGASVVALKVLDRNGAGTTSDVLAALEWVRANHRAYNIRIVNLSLGHPIFEAAADDPLVLAVEELTKRGIVVAVAAGNLGRLKTTGQTVYESVTSPGNAASVITVGASNTRGTLLRSDDVVADFSGRGPTRLDKTLKPDVVAPGQAVPSWVPAYSYLHLAYPQLLLPQGYMRLNGTSMATPVVAGAAALMLQANPSLSSHTVKAIVQYTAQRMTGFDLVSQGAGELNVAGAVRLAKLINTAAAPNTSWLRSTTMPTRADFLFGEIAAWGRATIWGKTIRTGVAPFVKLAQWTDSTVWGQAENIVWSMDQIVWSMSLDNIVWSMANDRIVWGMADQIVWSMSDDQIVWSMTDQIVWSMTDNIVWSMDQIVWSMDQIVWSMSDNIVWSMSELVGTADQPLPVTWTDIVNAYLAEVR